MKHLLISLLVLATQTALAVDEDSLSMQQIGSLLDANTARIAVVYETDESVQKSKSLISALTVEPLSAYPNLDKAKCSESERGLVLCTIDILSSCNTVEGVLSLTLSSSDVQGLVPNQNFYYFPRLLAKPERVGIPLIGCFGAGSGLGQGKKQKPQ